MASGPRAECESLTLNGDIDAGNGAVDSIKNYAPAEMYRGSQDGLKRCDLADAFALH
jgi:hypothetical protein